MHEKFRHQTVTLLNSIEKSLKYINSSLTAAVSRTNLRLNGQGYNSPQIPKIWGVRTPDPTTRWMRLFMAAQILHDVRNNDGGGGDGDDDDDRIVQSLQVLVNRLYHINNVSNITQKHLRRSNTCTVSPA